MKKQTTNAPLLLCTLCATMIVSACSPKSDAHGYIKTQEWKDNIKPGHTTKDEVLTNYGSPSSQSSFGAETWYYISNRKEAYAFFKPEVVEQEVVRIEFGPTGLVSSVETFDKESAQDIALARRTTPTEGHSLGFVEQTLGNIGRFNKGDKSTPAPGRKGGRY